jgi:hypothetical protein
MAKWRTVQAAKGSSLAGVIDLLSRTVKGAKLIFRGVGDARWNLETTLERAAKSLDLKNDQIADLEVALYREFRRRFHHYDVRVPDEDSTLEWLARMQHHGAPTRLLDWTYSAYVALFFAIERMPESADFAGVFIADGDQLRDSAASEAAAFGLSGYVQKLTPPNERQFEILFLRNRAPFVGAVNPYYLNERLTIQRGLFLAPGDVRLSFEDNLTKASGLAGAVTLVEIPRELREVLLRELFEMNISAATLFPGLDGFARSLAGWSPYIDGIRSGTFRAALTKNFDWKNV